MSRAASRARPLLEAPERQHRSDVRLRASSCRKLTFSVHILNRTRWHETGNQKQSRRSNINCHKHTGSFPRLTRRVSRAASRARPLLEAPGVGDVQRVVENLCYECIEEKLHYECTNPIKRRDTRQEIKNKLSHTYRQLPSTHSTSISSRVSCSATS